MNNKYLAIVLAIFAVVLVFYQFVLKKDNKPVIQRNQPPFRAAHPASADPRAHIVPQRVTAPEADQILIDRNSEILLTRVYDTGLEKALRRELGQSYGVKIFVKRPDGKILPGEEKTQSEIEFKLNAIIIDDNRKYTVVNRVILKEGDYVMGARVISIQKTLVVLLYSEKEIFLSTNSKIKKIKLIGGNGE